MQSEHIASLGSVDAEVSVRERLAFWAKLPERLARLGNRVGPDDQAKVYAALHARIPMVTPDEQRAIQEANAEGDERFWGAMRDMRTASVEEHCLSTFAQIGAAVMRAITPASARALIARTETKIAEHAPKAAEAGERAQAAKDRLERIRRGESVPAASVSRLMFAPRSRRRASLSATRRAANCWPA
jgi:hypothetical protein